MRVHILFTFILTTLSSCSSALLARDINPHSPTAREIVHLLEPGSWFKDIVTRKDGTVLVVRLDKPSVYLVHPTTGAFSVITTFKHVTSAFGIAEYAPDVFAVTIGNFSIATLTSTPGSWSVVTVDLSRGLNRDGTATPTTLAAIPSAGNLNGLAFRAPSMLYAADSTGFQIYSIDTRTRAVNVAVPPSPLLTTGSVGLIPLGVTALQWDSRGQQLYFANPNRAILGRIRASTGADFAAPEQIASSLATGGVDYDDFDLDPDQGNIYVVTGPSSTLNFVSRDGSRQFIISPDAASNTTIVGGTSTGWGRATGDRTTLYVTTNGNLLSGAQLIAFTFSTT